MTQKQTLHIAMLNSFNVITGRAEFDDIVESGIAMFSHTPDEELDYDNLRMIIMYFESVEMYEICNELKNVIDEHFNYDGTSKIKLCECELPTIKEYTEKMYCSTCNNRLIK